MDKFEGSAHTVGIANDHPVFVPKCQSKTLYLQLRCYLGEVFRKLGWFLE
jgi:hypothetical protein